MVLVRARSLHATFRLMSKFRGFCQIGQAKDEQGRH